MAELDAELYLRLAGETMLLDHRPGQGGPWESPLDSAGHALVAVGALAADQAQAIVDDYHLARCWRRGEEPYLRTYRLRLTAGSAGPAPPALGRFRAVACGRVIGQPWGELRVSYAVLSDEATVLHVTMLPARPAPHGQGRPSHTMARLAGSRGPGARGGYSGHHLVGPGLPGQLTLTDDQGTTASAVFSGGRDGAEWTGEFEARLPLALALEATIEVLTAAGALAAGDPVIADARAVLQQHSGSAGGGPAGGKLPEPWRSLLAASGRSTGRDGLVVVGAATPRFGGVAAAVLAVQTAADVFTVEVQLTPSLPHWQAGLSRVDEPILVWWAADDRGGHYLGQPGNWHSGAGRCGGQVEFWPALDPTATCLDVMPTTVTERAVIRVPLGRAAAR
ncbi:MAG TPA: hypothetical protein VMH35_14950 [Streptosporangiaceae bacterium]|nr:hypothetical protein [Streptosporangiaceae bacterium]